MDPVAQVQLGKDAIDVGLHRGWREVERVADLAVRESRHDAGENVELARTEVIQRVGFLCDSPVVMERSAGGVVVY